MKIHLILVWYWFDDRFLCPRQSATLRAFTIGPLKSFPNRSADTARNKDVTRSDSQSQPKHSGCSTPLKPNPYVGRIWGHLNMSGSVRHVGSTHTYPTYIVHPYPHLGPNPRHFCHYTSGPLRPAPLRCSPAILYMADSGSKSDNSGSVNWDLVPCTA